MFPGWTEVRARLDAGMKTLILSVVAASAAVAVVGLWCAALFIWVDGRFGATVACLVLGGVFFLTVCIAVVAIVLIRRRQARILAARKPSPATNLLGDPAVLNLALQVGRALGPKRAIPLALLGAFLVSIVLTRSASGDSEAPNSGSRR